jgi:hypothetical protein
MHIRRASAFCAVAAACAIAAAQARSDSRPDERMSGTGRLADTYLKAKGAPQCPSNKDCSDALSAGAPGTQSETAIAVDQTGRNIVVGFNDFRGFSNPVLSLSGFMISSDGGKTFTEGGQLPTPGSDLVGGLRLPAVFGDPDVKYLGGCNFLYSSLLLVKYGSNGIAQTLGLHRSTDCGRTWTGPIEIKPATNPSGRVDINGDAFDAADKALIDVDPDTSRVMICWSNFTPVAVGGVEISCAYSDNVLSSAPVFSVRRVVAAGPTDGQGAVVRFAGNTSSNVYVAWTRFPGFYTRRIGFSRSTDNGETWSPPVDIGGSFIAMDEVLGNDRVNNNPFLAVDNSRSDYKGNVYLVYSNNNSLDGADVSFRRSTDGGLTFSAPVVLNSRPGNDRAQWFPAVSVDSDTGALHVVYYDQGIDTSGDLTELTHLASFDGAVTWTPPSPITDRPFKIGWGNDTSQPNLGDYIQSVASKSRLLTAFARTTPISFTNGQPDTQFTTPDIDVRDAMAGAPLVPLRIGNVTFSDTGGDGRIDPGDTVSLRIPLVNYDTNPLHALTVSLIDTRLSTSTPGVTLLQRTATYPDAPPGATRDPVADFRVSISPVLRAGSNIAFTLEISSATGKTTLQLTLPTGTPIETVLLSENFDAVPAGTLPPGWRSTHGAGLNVVPWTTSATAPGICGDSNKAFHPNANDGLAPGQNSRWERLLSPVVQVPLNASYVTVEFDACYDTENDPNLRVLAYDGLFLRITDLTPGRTLRSSLIEAFEEEFTTGAIEHYPRHLPANPDPDYFDDMSVWAGDSGGPQHVRMKLPGMAGSTIQLRFEYTQDAIATCADVRPGHTCGVSVDNVVVRALSY